MPNTARIIAAVLFAIATSWLASIFYTAYPTLLVFPIALLIAAVLIQIITPKRKRTDDDTVAKRLLRHLSDEELRRLAESVLNSLDDESAEAQELRRRLQQATRESAERNRP